MKTPPCSKPLQSSGPLVYARQGHPARDARDTVHSRHLSLLGAAPLCTGYIAHTHTRDSHRCRLRPLTPGRNGLLSTHRRHPSRKRHSTRNKKRSALELSAVWDAPCGSVSNTEELTRPCVQAGLQGDNTSVEFRLMCS